MKRIMKTVQSSYLHLFNILSSRVEFSNRVIKSSFSTRLNTFSKKFQLDSTLFKLSTQLKLKYLTWRDQSTWNSTLQLCAVFSSWNLHAHLMHITLFNISEASALLSLIFTTESWKELIITSKCWVFILSFFYY